MKTFLERQVLSKKGVGKYTENFLKKTSFIKQLSLEEPSLRKKLREERRDLGKKMKNGVGK